MSSLSGRTSDSPHVERTKGSTRSDVESEVVVTETHKLSPTVKAFTLRVENNSVSFKCGQWVDLHIPSEDIVGGYSFMSPPHQLREHGTAELAIQSSDHSPTLWMTTKCKVGDRLSIRVGGDFVYNPTRYSELGELLLIAGGVGINPLFSMLRHHIHLLHSSGQSSNVSDSPNPKGRVQLLYSARSQDELIFKDRIDEIVEQCGGLVQVGYFVTKEKISDSHIRARRMSNSDIRQALSLVDTSSLQCYICGPPPMTEDILSMVTTQCGVATDRVHYEKWW